MGLPVLIEVRIFIKTARKRPRNIPMASLNQNVIKHKIGLLNLAAELGNVTKAAR